MINIGNTRGIYRYQFVEDAVAYRAVGKLTAKALHDPRVDKEAFHPLHWRYLLRGSYVRSQGHKRYFKANLKEGLRLFDLTPEDLG
jgi:hypothetical protein